MIGNSSSGELTSVDWLSYLLICFLGLVVIGFLFFPSPAPDAPCLALLDQRRVNAMSQKPVGRVISQVVDDFCEVQLLTDKPYQRIWHLASVTVVRHTGDARFYDEVYREVVENPRNSQQERLKGVSGWSYQARGRTHFLFSLTNGYVQFAFTNRYLPRDEVHQMVPNDQAALDELERVMGF